MDTVDIGKTANTDEKIYFCNSGYTINVDGGSFKAQTEGSIEWVRARSMFMVSGNEINFNDVEIENDWNGGIYILNKSEANITGNTKINITKAVPSSGSWAFGVNAIAAAYGATANVKSGTYTSKGYSMYVYSSGGNINVTGDATFNHTSDTAFVIKKEFDSENYGEYYAKSEISSNVNISNGTFNIPKAEKFAVNNDSGTTAVKESLVVTGGVFSKDISAFIANDYKENCLYFDEKFYVGDSRSKMTATAYSLYIDDIIHYYSTPTAPSDAVAQIGTNKYYTTFDNAKAKAASGDTIKLVNNAEVSSESNTITNELTIDLNGKTLTGSSGITVSSTLNVIDSAGGSGTLAAAITNSGTVNVSNGKITNTVTNNGTFTMTGGSVDTTDDAGTAINAIVNNAGGTLNINGGQIKSDAIGINNYGTNNISGGSIFGMVGIRMLAGILGILGGKIRGYAKGASGKQTTSTEPENVVSPETDAEDAQTEAGTAISIAQQGTTSDAKVAVTIGQENADTKADIDIAGTKTALNIGTSNVTDADTAPSVSLFEGKLASIKNESYDEEETTTGATGSAITYADDNETQGAQTKLTIDGAILKNKIDVSTTTNIGSAETTGETTNSIVIKKVAISKDAANSMITEKQSGRDTLTDNAKAFQKVFQMDITGGTTSTTEVATMSLDGQEYGFVGSATTEEGLNKLKEQTAGEASVAKIGKNFYSGLAEAIAATSKEGVTSEAITLSRNINTANQLTLLDGISLSLNGKTFTYTGGGNAALTIEENATVTLNTDQLLDSNGNVLGIAMPEGAEVKIGDTAFTKSAKIMTSSTDTLPTYFQNINDAMKQFDQPGEILMASITSSTATNNVPADEPGVVSPADAADESGNLRITLSGSEVELTGLAASKEVTISNDEDNKKNITLNKSNFGSSIIVLGNAGNYKFNLLDEGGDSSGTLSFTGSDVGEVISNAIGSLTLSGAGGADTITNTGASATINGGEGNDSIINTADNASVNGGAGADNINNSNAKATIEGGDGADTISNGGQSAYISGGAGNDKITNTYTPAAEDTSSVVTIDGGDGSDTLVGYSSGKELFYYSKGNDSITGYGEGDIISLTGTAVSPFTDISKFSVDSNKFTFNFGTNNTVNVDVSGVSTVSIKSGTDNYYYSANSVAKNTNGVTLTSAYTTQNFSASISGTENSYTTVDASAVTVPVSIKGVDDKDNYLIASESKGGTLDAGTGTNSLYGGTSGADLFVHSANAKDFIFNYTYGKDTVSVSNAATDLETGINYDGSNFVVSLGASDSLTFNTASAVELKDATNTYYYAADQAMKNGESLMLKSTFSTTTFNLNASKWNGLYAGVSSIDASKVTQDGGLKITGISGNANWIKSASLGGAITGGANGNTLISATDSAASLTLTGGEGADSLIGDSGKDLFVYTGGADSINNYASGDTVRVNNTYRLAEATVAVGTVTDNKANITLTFDNANSLIFESIGANDAVRVQQGTGSNYYTYAQQYYAHNNSVTLAAGYSSGTPNTFNGADTQYENYETINAAAVTAANGISIVGNTNANYIFGPTAVGASINGGIGNDKINVSDRSSTASYLFEYTAGKDEVIGFASGDSVDIDPTSITAAKSSNSNTKLALTVDKNKNVLTLRSDDEITKVTLSSGAEYLTKDGYVAGQGFSLFGSARGSIDLKDALYADSNISLVAADSVKSQSVTLTGGTQGGTFIYAPNNKRRDGFVYGGGNVSISGYEAGRDRIDLNEASLTSFTVDDSTNEIVLKVGDGTISIESAKDKEVLLHDATRGRGYKKMVFAKTGVIENKAKNPTIATVSGAATNYSVLENGKTTIKKIYVTGLNAAGASIQAGDKNNTQIDARAAGYGVSLSGGAKNDKLIGNTVASANDLFVYNAGKDVIQNYSEGDLISISGGLEDSLGNAKITTGSRSIKFQFTNKNTLTIKSNTGETLSNELTINNTTQTYAKNAIESGGQVTLTSAYSGTFNTASTKGIDGAVSTVDGAAVSRNLSYKGSTAAESLTGGTKKTTFKGAGGADTLVGGTGKDIFFYAKNDAGTTTIADFEFGANKDKLKIASGTISEISSVTADSKTAIRFAMNSGKNTANVGWFQVTSGATYGTNGSTGQKIDASKVAIKANNTFYWFNQDSTAQDSDGNAVGLGQLITSDTRVSASDVSSYSVIDLNYSTNLAKAGVAVKVANAKPTNS